MFSLLGLTGWRATLRQASFRGVPFYVDTAEDEGGHRVAEHEYPGRNLGWAEPMGCGLDGFQVDAYLVGPTHITDSDRLIAAIKADGAATLVLPWQGERQVICRRYRRSFRRLDGGVAYVQMDCVEAGEQRYPDNAAQPTTQIGRLAAAAKAALGETFGAVFETAGHWYDVAAAAAQDAQVGIAEVRGAIEPAVAAVSDAAAWLREADALSGSALSLVSNPSQIGGRLLSWFGMPAPQGTTATLSWRTWLPVTSMVIDRTADHPETQSAPITTATATTQRMAQNTAALQNLIQAGALAEAARSAVSQSTLVTATTSSATYATAADALAARDALSTAFDAVEAALPDAAIDSFIALRAETLSALTAMAPTLPSIQSITLPAALPGLVLAARLYGQSASAILDRTDELVARNGIRHPGFLPAGEALQALVEG